MHAEHIAEEFPVVTIDSSALDAARMLAEHRLPGIVVTDSRASPTPCCPPRRWCGSSCPRYVQDDPALAGVINDSGPTVPREKLAARRCVMCCPSTLVDMPAANADDTIIEVAALMVRLRSPLIAVMKEGKLHGVITASRLLAAALRH